MPNSDIVQVVADKVETETHIANNIANKLRKEKRSFTSLEIREFFPRHEKLWDNNRTNLISEVSIASQLIYGSPVTIGIYPESVAQFEKRYKIDYKAALLLAEEGWIFPSLYVQNPKDWNGRSELLDLVKVSEINGIRVNKYLENRFPTFTDSINSRTKRSECIIEKLKEKDRSIFQQLCHHLSASDASAARVLGNRWAYIDCFAPDSSKVFNELIYASDIENALNYLGVVQNLTVSPISGSLGGHLTWSSSAITRLRNVLNGNLKHSSKLTQSISEWQINDRGIIDENKRINEFLLQQITGASPYENLELSGAHKLSKITRSSEFKHLKMELNKTMREIAEKSDKGIDDLDLKEWISISNEIEKHVTLFKKLGVIATNGIGLALGLLTSNWQAAVGMTVVNLFDFQTNFVSNSLHKLFKKNDHRFGLSIAELNRLSKEIPKR